MENDLLRKGINKLVPVIVAASLVTAIGCELYPTNGDGPPLPDPPTPSGPEPSAELQQLVSPLRGIISETRDIVMASQFFEDFADVVERDTEVIASTQQLRAGYIRSEKLMLQRTDMVGKYPGFGEAKDKVLATVLGLDNVSLTAEKRQKAVAAFEAIAWAIRSATEDQ